MTPHTTMDLFKLIKEKESFLIACHVHPDGDAIGSMLALGLSLLKLGKQVSMVCAEGVPNVYSFLEGSQLISKTVDLTAVPEVLISVDCAERERMSLPPAIWSLKSLYIVNIDHHITNLGFGDLNIIDANAAATGEIVYQLLREGGLELDRDIATAIYTAVATDTGFFRYANTASTTLELASLIVKDFGVEPAKVAEQVHEQKSINSIRLLGEVFRTLEIGLNNKVAWMVLSQTMLSKYPVENEETESYVNYARSIEGVEIAILFKELRPNEVKLSWRSTSAADVSKLAAYFGGGGHARAAGCNLNGPIDQVVKQVIDFVADYYGSQ